MHKCIGLLLFDIPDYKSDAKGTSVMISNNLVLTAAHNIIHYKFMPHRLSTDVRFFPGADGEIDIYEDCYRI